MNFQLRFSPISLPVYEAIKQNILGEYINSDLYGYSQPADNIVLGTEEPEA